MTLLIDTQVLLWFQEDNPQLPVRNKLILEDPLNTIWVSQVSLFEIAIKLKIGKLPDFVVSILTLTEQIREDGFAILPLHNEHITAYVELPLLDDHRDPFDRLIMATALHENWPVMSADATFSRYKDLVTVIW
ncbi:MAG: type II toxin-antitoxin system VapC family toxin [Bacteroidetes bacterium]|nr:type II toxin-antitoxin system VapC family toxin [Fibrella sp.]